jgi:hypothetical protein
MEGLKGNFLKLLFFILWKLEVILIAFFFSLSAIILLLGEVERLSRAG